MSDPQKPTRRCLMMTSSGPGFGVSMVWNEAFKCRQTLLPMFARRVSSSMADGV
jgi:hypothetical protein